MCCDPETTIHNAEDLKVFRTPETRPHAPMAWYPLRRGVADLYRRAQISRAANDRYLTALAAASITTPTMRGVRGARASPAAPATASSATPGSA